MLTLLSPSKSVMKQSQPVGLQMTTPLFGQKTDQLVAKLRGYSPKQLQKHLGISAALAEHNYARFQMWDQTELRAALWMYSGDVYNGVDAYSLDKQGVAFATEHVAIISGLYGLLRPLDAVQPYRLEMRSVIRVGSAKNLYHYWGETLAQQLQNRGHTTILMCASPEYSQAITPYVGDEITVITPRFKQKSSDGYREKGLFAKYARGALARWVIDHRIDDPSKLLDFNTDGFVYSEDLSTDTEPVFIIPPDFTLKGRFTKK